MYLLSSYSLRSHRINFQIKPVPQIRYLYLIVARPLANFGEIGHSLLSLLIDYGEHLGHFRRQNCINQKTFRNGNFCHRFNSVILSFSSLFSLCFFHSPIYLNRYFSLQHLYKSTLTFTTRFHTPFETKCAW